MSEEFDYNFDNDVTLDVDEKNVGGNQQEWLKMTTKNQVLRVAFVYFKSVDHNANAKAHKDALRAGRKLTKEEMVEVAKKSLASRAAELNKSVEQLTATEKMDLKVAHFHSMKVHYQEGVGYAISRLGKDGPEADAVWRRLPEAKPYFSTLLLVYPTDDQGNLNKDLFGQQVKSGSVKLVPWRFGRSVYDEIWKLNDGLRENTLSLATQDIKLECKEPKFQNIKVSFAGAAVWQKNDAIKQVVLSKAITMYGDKIVPFREMSTDQLRIKLGLGGSAVSDTSTDDFAGMLDQV